MRYEEALKHCIFKYISGSHQYGTNRPDSDVDHRGVFIAPMHYAFDLFQSNFVGSGTIRQTIQAAMEQMESGDLPRAANLLYDALQTDRGDLSISVETVHLPGADEELQELRKFLKLAADCNPNIIEFLYVEHLIDICTPEWERIREHRDLFLSKRARWTYGGYCIAQLRKIRSHRSYLLNPPSHKPTREEFGLNPNTKIKKEHQNAIMILPMEWLEGGAREEVRREKQYDEALRNWNAYQKWDRERNPARKELERKFGYDTKHSAHLVRLARSASEILREGVVRVRRPDADDLKGILNGEWKYEEVEAVANDLDAQLDALYDKSPLRDSPDRGKIAELYQSICEERYGIKLR